MDATIAITDFVGASSAEALEEITKRLGECGADGEFILVAPNAPSDLPESINGFPLRHVPVDSEMYGDALRAMRDNAQGDWLFTLESPSLDDASLIFGLWHRRNDADLLIASRYIFGGSSTMPWPRKVISRLLNKLYHSGLSMQVHDLSSSRRLYRMRVLRQVEIDGKDYDVLMEALLKFMSRGGRHLEYPWHYESAHYRQKPGTLVRLLMSSLWTFRKLHALRNSVGFPDYDTRAYDSRIWLQKFWKRSRFKIVRGFEGGGLTLDAGCGTSRIISTRPEMIAMDLNFTRLRYLRPSNPRRLQATAGDLPFGDEIFDTVVSSQVIEHTPEDTCIKECIRVLKPGGTLVLGTPDYGRIWWPITEKIYGWVKRGGYADEHITHYTLPKLIDECERHGCEVLDYKYILGGELIIQAKKLGDTSES